MHVVFCVIIYILIKRNWVTTSIRIECACICVHHSKQQNIFMIRNEIQLTRKLYHNLECITFINIISLSNRA